MAIPIQVVLQKDVEHLGDSGDVVRVKPGYARNYLVPRGLAAAATPGNLARIDELKAAAAERAKALHKDALALKGRLEAVSIKITRQVGEENKMYGSVTTRDIEEAFEAAHGIKFDRRKLVLPEPIRVLGLTEVSLKIHPEVSALLRVEVVKEG